MLNDSPNFDCANFESAKSTEKPSSSCESSSKFQWPSQQKNQSIHQSIPSTLFYNKADCDTTSRIEKTLQSQHEADLYRKSRSTLLDAADREHYARELAEPYSKQTATGGSSSLLSALDEDYGVRNVVRTVDEMFNSTTPTKIERLDCIVDIFAGNEGDDCEQNIEIEEKLMEMEQSNEDSEGVISCTPPSEKSLKRNKKQRKITDMYPTLKADQ